MHITGWWRRLRSTPTQIGAAVAETTTAGIRLSTASLPIRMTAFAVFASVLFLGSEIWRDWTARAQHLRVAGAALASLATSLAQHAEELVEMADNALVGLAERRELDGTSPAALARLDQLIATQIAALPRVRSLTVYGDDGSMLASSLSARRGDGGDQASFRHHRDIPGQAPFVGPPVRDQVDGQWNISISRRLEHADGRFAGIALARSTLRI